MEKKTTRERAKEWVEAQEAHKVFGAFGDPYHTLLIQFLCDEIDRLERKLNRE